MKITCLVDNAVHPHSSFWGEHGLAFLIESEDGRLLFDTGASDVPLLHNLEAAGVAPESISVLALSHAHRDHTGGLPALLKRRPGLPIYANPDLLRERFSRWGGQMKAKGLPMDSEVLRQRVDLRLSGAPQEILPGIWTTGEISERSEPEGRSANHFVRDGEGWAADPYRDDMALVLESSPGLILVCGCCHAGLLNTMSHVRRTFGQDPVAVVGGMHLISADEAHMRRLMEVLGRLGPPALYPNHCTGQAAYVTLAQAFGDRVAPCPAGTVLDF
jgi:7,8-dihydropterin-6-yl-methyl-4-(beta-D-ribofuranosyl)aminobenzene 5'-phosphate synthase